MVALILICSVLLRFGPLFFFEVSLSPLGPSSAASLFILLGFTSGLVVSPFSLSISRSN